MLILELKLTYTITADAFYSGEGDGGIKHTGVPAKDENVKTTQN